MTCVIYLTCDAAPAMLFTWSSDAYGVENAGDGGKILHDLKAAAGLAQVSTGFLESACSHQPGVVI